MKKLLIIIGIVLSLSGIAQARIKVSDLILESCFEDAASSGIAFDSSGGGRNGTITGCISSIGLTGVCKSFDGIDDEINYGRIVELEGATAQYSICLWVELVPDAGNRMLYNYDQNSTGEGNDIYLYWIGGGSALHCETGSAGEITSNITNLGDGLKHRIVLVKTSTSVLLYEDGVLKDNIVKAGGTFGSIWSFKLGAKCNIDAWSGLQDELKIYKRALTETEIRQDMINLSPGE